MNDLSQVICISIMTHKIPAYSLIIRTILKQDNIVGIIPISSIFDLKVITRYLSDAYEFLYYFAARTLLAEYLMYGTEQALLAFHLKARLAVPDTVDFV